MRSGEEIELKLATTPAGLKQLRRAPALRAMIVGRGRSQLLESHYFDTPTRALAERGLALRVRKIGRRYIQTLKAPLGEGGGAQHYQEYEATRPGPEPDLSLIPDRALQTFFANESIAAALQPLFVTRIRRQTLPLVFGDSRIELALDQGVIEAGGRSEPVCEAELELKDGEVASLYSAALALHGEAPFYLEPRSKAARGHALALGLAPQEVKAGAVELSSRMTAAEAFVVVARSCLAQLLGNEPAALEGKPEGIHQMRVSLRRLRAALGLFQALFDAGALQRWKEELAWLQEALGPARDWDVFLAETLRPLREQVDETGRLDRLEKCARQLQSEAKQRANAAIREPRYSDLLLRLGLSLEARDWLGASTGAEGVEAFAKEVLSGRVRKVLKRARNHQKLDEVQLHELRISAKKLRYALEFFRDLYGKKAVREALDALTALQDCLGAINDAAVGRSLLDQLRVRLSAGVKARRLAAVAEREHAIGLISGWQAQRIARDLVDFDKVWRRTKRAIAGWKA